MTTLTEMELEGMKNGCFNMAKDESIEACKAYRAKLEAQGFKTRMEYFTGDLWTVEKY